MSEVRVTTLDNGLRVATDFMPHVETVSIGVWIGVGTRNESAGVNGIAHLLEHMAFKGTARRDARQIAEEIESVGGHLNAYTGRENTAYFAKIMKGDVALAVDILSDILQHSMFDNDELARERAVVLQEIGQAQDTPDDLIFDVFQSQAFPDQPLGRPVLGLPDIVATLSRDALFDYLGAHYRGGDMVLAAAGNVDHDTLVALAGEAFATLQPGANGKVDAARYAGGDYREDRDLEQVHMLLGFRGASFHDADFYDQSVLSNLLGGGMSSRLFQEVREKRGLAYAIHSFTSSFTDDGIFGVYAGTGESEAAELVPVVCGELARLADTMTEDETARSRTQLKANLLMSLESTSMRCEQLAQHLLIFGRVISVAELTAKIDAVDAAAVTQAAGRLLTAEPPTFAALGPLSSVTSFDDIVASVS